MKEVKWAGRSLEELRGFPDDAKQDLGYQIDQVQRGKTPVASKSMSDVGTGGRELRVKADDSWFRAFYVASIGDYVWILHCFQKKTNSTSDADIAIGKKRYKEVE